mgnify:FL=1|tara:strand:- start:8301 stop:8468 length:168 start_codon:yes stop_codon:yes gene_type:complete
MIKKESPFAIEAMNQAVKSKKKKKHVTYRDYVNSALQSSDNGRCWWIYEWLMMNR